MLTGSAICAKLDAVDGAGVHGGRAGVGEGPGGGAALGQDGRGRDADGGVGDVALGDQRGVGGVEDAGDLQAVVQAEDDDVQVFEGLEGDLGGGGHVAGRGVEVGVDVVVR